MVESGRTIDFGGGFTVTVKADEPEVRRSAAVTSDHRRTATSSAP